MSSIVDQQPFNEYEGNGVATVYPYEFELLSADDLVVTIDGVVIPASDFTLSGVGVQAGGDVTFDTAPADQSVVLIKRDIVLERDTDYQYGGDLLEATLDRDFNRLWMAAQEMRAAINGVMRAPYPEVLADMPAAADRAGLMPIFDTDGDVTVSTFTADQVASAVAAAYTAASLADAVSYLQAGVGAAWQTVQYRLRKTIWVDDYNTLEDAQIYAASLGRGRGVKMRPGQRYTLTVGRVLIPSGGGIYCSQGTAEIYAPASLFTNTNLSNKYAATSAVIDMSGELSGGFAPSVSPYLVGIRLASEVSDGRMVDAITARNVRDLRIENCEFSGFPVGCDIRASTLDCGRIVHTRHLGRNSTHVWGSQPQSTAIELDNDRVNSTASDGLQIDHPVIRDFTITGQSSAAWNHQTDGINIAHRDSKNTSITAADIDNVGEGIDIFGANNVVNGFKIRNAKFFGLKFIHGAQFNVAGNGSILNFGIAGAVFAGTSDVGAGDTSRNRLSNTTITNGDYLGTMAATEVVACVKFEDNGGATGKPKDNGVSNCALSEGATGEYAWYDGSTGTNNYGSGITIAIGAANVKRVEVIGGAGVGSVQLHGSLTYHTSLA